MDLRACCLDCVRIRFRASRRSRGACEQVACGIVLPLDGPPRAPAGWCTFRWSGGAGPALTRSCNARSSHTTSRSPHLPGLSSSQPWWGQGRRRGPRLPAAVMSAAGYRPCPARKRPACRRGCAAALETPGSPDLACIYERGPFAEQMPVAFVYARGEVAHAPACSLRDSGGRMEGDRDSVWCVASMLHPCSPGTCPWDMLSGLTPDGRRGALRARADGIPLAVMAGQSRLASGRAPALAR